LCLFSGEGGHKEDPVPPDAGQEGEGIPGLEGDEGGAEGPEEPHLRLQAGGGLLHRPGQAEQVSKQLGRALVWFGLVRFGYGSVSFQIIGFSADFLVLFFYLFFYLVANEQLFLGLVACVILYEFSYCTSN
jgi:hypothetical protein